MSLSVSAQRSTFGFYKVSVFEIDANSYEPVSDTSSTLANGEVRFVGNYVTFDYSSNGERFYNITETTIDGKHHSHVLWSTKETLVAQWSEGGSEILLVTTQPESKYDNTLTVMVHHLTKKTESLGTNKYPKKGEVKIKPLKSKEDHKSKPDIY